MLNQLVRKHPGVGALYPMRIDQALTHGTFTPGQFEIVTVLLTTPTGLTMTRSARSSPSRAGEWSLRGGAM